MQRPGAERGGGIQKWVGYYWLVQKPQPCEPQGETGFHQEHKGGAAWGQGTGGGGWVEAELDPQSHPRAPINRKGVGDRGGGPWDLPHRPLSDPSWAASGPRRDGAVDCREDMGP